MIAFNEPHLIGQYVMVHPVLIEVAEWIDREVVGVILKQRFMVITAVWYEGRSGVHEQYRALDWSARDNVTGELLPKRVCLQAQARINGAWDHGSGGRYNVCWYHRLTTGAWHFHTQVRPQTELRHHGRESGSEH